MASTEIIPVDDQFVTLVRTELTDDDAQQFIINFQLYLTHGNDKTKFVVDLDDVWPWLGLSRKDVAKYILTKHFEEKTDFMVIKILQNLPVRPFGGQNKEQILMNVETFKGMCMLANTEKGKKVRRYYSKVETLFFKYIEEKHKAALLAMQQERLSLESSLIRQREIDIERKLIEAFKDTPLVYIIRIGTKKIKIGETDNIEIRIIALRLEYSDCVLLDAFPCQRPHKFEQYLIHRRDFKEHADTTTETFQLDDTFTYEYVINKIKKHIDQFDGVAPDEKIRLLNIRLKEKYLSVLEKTEKEEERAMLLSMLNKMDEIQEDEDSDKESETEKFRNRFVYQYDLTDLKTPINTFYSLRQAARSLNNPQFYDYHIRNASINNTVFAGYRWFYHDGDNPPQEIPATEAEAATNPKKNKGLIAQINKEKTVIIKVFKNQRDAESHTKIPNCQISVALSKNSMCRGCYWMLYDNCSDALKATYTEAIPQEQRDSKNSKRVQRIDPHTNKVLETFSCMQDVCNAFNCCHKSIHNAHKSSDIFKNYKWNIV